MSQVTKARKYPFVISVRFDNGDTKYLAGHGSKDGKGMETICLFTDNPDDAISSMSRDVMLMGWPMLLSSHCRTMGIRAQAVVHQTNEEPEWG